MPVIAIAPCGKLHDYEEAVRRAGGEPRVIDQASDTPAAVIAGNSATNDDINRIREQLGLDRSIVSQYFIWIGRVFQGDLGFS